MSVIMVMTGTANGWREGGRANKADLVGREEKRSCRSKPVIPLWRSFARTELVYHVCCETLNEDMARLFTQTVTSRAVIGTRSSQGFDGYLEGALRRWERE